MKKQDTSQLIVVVEPAFELIERPASLKVHKFGSETIVDEHGKMLAYGYSAHITGPTDDVRKWIKDIGGKVWTSTNPMIGNWELFQLEA